MWSPIVLLATTAALYPAYAFQLPFKLPFFSRGQQEPLTSLQLPAEDTVVPNRIAIIGAGAGGSSAAFWIAKARERAGVKVQVDVFERSDYVGGRKYFSGTL